MDIHNCCNRKGIAYIFDPRNNELQKVVCRLRHCLESTKERICYGWEFLLKEINTLLDSTIGSASPLKFQNYEIPRKVSIFLKNDHERLGRKNESDKTDNTLKEW
ncbi:hypothetical protein Glove_141g36 [Diversispora epigaea]|uniref:Uncharacterized protein n=1 Tax=Diversispora epigaea TaxID=1348612 RepID=A0A397IYP6_9GLOM|nr:hypothetical protein Glove_141g36 [Diversispora epigaea]